MMKWLRKPNSLSKQLKKYLNRKMAVLIQVLNIFKKNL